MRRVIIYMLLSSLLLVLKVRLVAGAQKLDRVVVLSKAWGHVQHLNNLGPSFSSINDKIWMWEGTIIVLLISFLFPPNQMVSIKTTLLSIFHNSWLLPSIVLIRCLQSLKDSKQWIYLCLNSLIPKVVLYKIMHLLRYVLTITWLLKNDKYWKW